MRTLAEWLHWQEQLHPSSIELGLGRVRCVAERMGLLNVPFPIIIVGGTNGKGSSCAMLTSALLAAGHRVGTYTSPHVLHYNERIALNGVPASDELICAAFRVIEAVRAEVSLTFFEFSTLAAVYLFVQQNVDVAVLEVGLGGRLDATNLWDADIALLTSIALDHTDWLGDTRAAIGAEKAAIAKHGALLICADNEPPSTIATTVSRVGASLWQIGRDFNYQLEENGVTLCLHGALLWDELPKPPLLGAVQLKNMACVVVALHALQSRYPALAVSKAALISGLVNVKLLGRLQALQRRPDVWVDVAHNPQAAEELARWLASCEPISQVYAIFSMFADKDIETVVRNMSDWVSEWHIAKLPSNRALAVTQIAAIIKRVKPDAVVVEYDTISTAWQRLSQRLVAADRVVAFGSFLVVAEMLDAFTPHHN